MSSILSTIFAVNSGIVVVPTGVVALGVAGADPAGLGAAELFWLPDDDGCAATDEGGDGVANLAVLTAENVNLESPEVGVVTAAAAAGLGIEEAGAAGSRICGY